eukprot:Skav213122  [mRNA]  locus=scaffold107:93664:94113:- [translate_table: standard]
MLRADLAKLLEDIAIGNCQLVHCIILSEVHVINFSEVWPNNVDALLFVISVAVILRMAFLSDRLPDILRKRFIFADFKPLVDDCCSPFSTTWTLVLDKSQPCWINKDGNLIGWLYFFPLAAHAQDAIALHLNYTKEISFRVQNDQARLF